MVALRSRILWRLVERQPCYSSGRSAVNAALLQGARNSDFPIFRLMMLLMRQISSPVATRIKEYARTHPWFSRRVCMATGRTFHAVQLRFQMWSLSLNAPRSIPTISDAAALDSGATLLGEVIVFSLGALIIFFEVNRQANNKEDKELAVKSQWAAILAQLEELQHELTVQQQDIDRLNVELRRLASLKTPVNN